MQGKGDLASASAILFGLLKGENTGISAYFLRDLDLKLDFWNHHDLECRDALLSWFALTVVWGCLGLSTYLRILS